MNIQKKVEVYLDKKRNTRQIDVVQGDKGIQLVFMLMDFIAPDGTTATLYVQKPSGKFVYQEENITVSSDTVTVDLENQAITEYGKVYYQLALVNGDDEITTFASLMLVEKKYADSGAEESKTVISSFKQLTLDQIAQIKAATQTQIATLQTESARQQELIEGKGNTTLASIPEDYTATYNMAVEALRTKAPVIVQKASGSDILVKDGARMSLQDFTTYGASEQAQGNFFDGELAQGIYSTTGSITSASGRVSAKNLIPCNEGDVIKFTYEESARLIIAYFNNGTYVSQVDVSDTTEATYTVASDITHIGITIIKDGITPTTAKAITVTVNGSTSYPSPNNLQEILSNGHRGYFDGELLQGFYDGTTGVQTTASNWICSANPMPCISGDTVNVEYSEIATSLTVAYYDENMGYIGYKGSTNISSLSVTMPSNAKYFHININVTALTPTTAKHICVTINGMYALVVKSTKQEFDGELLQGYYNSSNGELATNNQMAVCSKNTIPCDEGDSIKVKYPDTLSQIRICYYNNGTYSSFEVANNVSEHTFTVPSNATEFHITVISNDRLSPTTAKQIIVNINNQQQTTYIPIAEPLRGIGEVKDSVKKVDGLYGEGRKFKETIFDGSDDEAWTISGGEGFYTTILNAIAKKSQVCLSNAYSNNGTDTTAWLGKYKIGIGATGALWITDDRFSTVDEWKANLQANPITVQYELAEETFTPFADQTPFYNMKTFDGVTLITNSDDAEMEIEYATDTKTYIDNKFAELSAALLSN